MEFLACILIRPLQNYPCKLHVSGVMHHMTMYSFVYCSMELVVDAGAVLLGLRIIAAAIKNSNGGVTLRICILQAT